MKDLNPDTISTQHADMFDRVKNWCLDNAFAEEKHYLHWTAGKQFAIRKWLSLSCCMVDKSGDWWELLIDVEYDAFEKTIVSVRTEKGDELYEW